MKKYNIGEKIKQYANDSKAPFMAALLAITLNNYGKGSFPSTNNVQEGFAPTSELEIKLADLDGNGKDEVYLVRKGLMYEIKENATIGLKVEYSDQN